MPQNGKTFDQVKDEENIAIAENDKLYDKMIGDTDKYYDDQIQAAKDWADTQTQLQQQQTDFTIEKIEQQKDQAEKDYIKEQSGAYKDWQKQTNNYGVNAEQMAATGMSGTGYSESSKVSMYNTYQTRVATARESYQRAVLNYDNAIKDAQLQNSAILAEIAYEALQKQLELSLQGFQYKNTLILEKASTEREIKSFYYQQWKDVLDQINTEASLSLQGASLAQSAQQHAENLAWQKEQFEWEKEYKAQQLAEEQRQFDETLAWEKEQEKNKSSSTTSNNSSNTTKPSSTPNSSSGNNIVGTVNKPFNGTTYSEAIDYLRANGLQNDLLTRNEWLRRKASYNQTGIGDYDVSGNATYSDYLRTKTEYLISNKNKK